MQTQNKRCKKKTAVDLSHLRLASFYWNIDKQSLNPIIQKALCKIGQLNWL